ncbi:MAG TPA: hypothetical protein VK442_05520 [Xanthobacteraceae bacterium]|nr:hypothetical protein [Xanthobacteraceae bacterium]
MTWARRTFAIVSTISIPRPAPVFPTKAIVNPPFRGSFLDADHPQNGVLIPRRFTLDTLPEGLEGSRMAEKLEAIAELDLDELQAIDTPRGYGRD